MNEHSICYDPNDAGTTDFVGKQSLDSCARTCAGQYFVHATNGDQSCACGFNLFHRDFIVHIGTGDHRDKWFDIPPGYTCPTRE